MRLVLLLLPFLAGCLGVVDPFDPPIGPRNPLPGVERYLLTRNDISAGEKYVFIAQEPCPLATLRSLADAPAREVRALVAGNPSADSSLLARLARDADPAVRQYVAGNHNTPHDVLVDLAKDADDNVRVGLLTNPNWSPEELRRMYAARPGYGFMFAGNTSLPSDLLEELSRSRDHMVRSALAGNHSITPLIMERLARSPEPMVRQILTRQPHIPRKLLEQLAKDGDETVRQSALEKMRNRTDRGSAGK